MDKRLNYFAICSFVMTLVLLYITSSTNWILKPKVDHVHKATLLISDVDSGSWRNYRIGVEYASKKYNLDMAVKTLFDFNDNAQQQLEQILTEIEFGTEGFILATSHFQEMSKLLEAEKIEQPVLFTKIDTSFCKNNYGDCTYIYYDYYGAGEILGEFLQKTYQQKESIIMVAEREFNKNHDFFFQALRQTHNVIILQNAILETDGVQQIKSALNENDIIIGLDENSILHFTDVPDVPIYSLGYTNTLIDAVLQGDIDGMVCFDEYMAGYLSVRNLVTVLEGRVIDSCEIIPYELITKETLFTKETFLFPIQ